MTDNYLVTAQRPRGCAGEELNGARCDLAECNSADTIGAESQQDESALGELRCLARLLETVLLALLATSVAGEEAGLLQGGAEFFIEFDE